MIKGFRKSCIIFICLIMALCSVYAAEIYQNGAPFPTKTQIEQNGNVFNIHTNTTIKGGKVGVNTFGRFNVDQGDVVNFNLINGQNKLINLIYDDAPSYIDGIVNSYVDGKIGGNVLFANPNGFVIGKTGVFNVGSLTLITPTKDSMDSFLNATLGEASGSLSGAQLDKLISFSFKGDSYFVGGDSTEPIIELDKSAIRVDGTINAENGIDLISGGLVDIKKDAKLNANVKFEYDTDPNNTYTFTYGTDEDATTEQLSIVKNTSAKPSVVPLTSSFAKDDGNGIVIVASNDGTRNTFLNAIVNLNGNVNANGSNVVVRTETVSGGTSKIDMNSTLNANDLTLSAKDGSITSTAPAGADFTVNNLNIQAGRDVKLVNDGDINISSLSCSDANPVVEFVSRNRNISSSIQLVASKLTLTAVKGDVSLSEVYVGELILRSTTATIDNAIVQSTANLETSGKLTLGTVDIYNLLIDSDSAEIAKLASNIDAKIKTKGLLKITDVDSITTVLNVGSAEIDKMKTADLQLTAGSADIADLTTEHRAKFDISETLTITKGDVGFVQADAKKIVVENSLNATSTEDNSWLRASEDILSIGTLTTKTDATLSSKGDMTVTTLSTEGDADLSSDAAITVTSATVGKDATLSSNGATTVSTGNITGALQVTKSGSFTSDNTLTVNGETNIQSSGAVTLNDTDLQKLTINSASADITTLNSGDTTIATTGFAKLGTAKVDVLDMTVGSTDIISLTSGVTTITATGNAKLGTAMVGSIILSSGSADITTLNTLVGDATLTAKTGDLSVESLTTAKDASLTTNTGNLSVGTLNSTGDATLTSAKNVDVTTLKSGQSSTLTAINGSITLGTVNSGNDFTSVSKSLDINTAMTVGGTVNMTADSIDIAPTVSFADLTISADTLEFDNLTVTGNADIGATTSFTVDTANIKDLTLNAGDINITTTLGVTGKGTISATGNINATNGTIEIGTLEKLSAKNADIKNLTITSTNNKTINITEDLTLDTASFDSVSITAKSLDVKTSLETTVGNATLTATTGDLSVKSLTIKGDATLTSAGTLGVTSATVGKDATLSSKGNMTVTTLVSEGDATLTSAGTLGVTSATVGKDATLSSNGATTVSTGNITGDLKVTKSGSFTSDSKLIVNGETNIQSSGAVELAETDMKKLTIESNSAKVTGLKSGETKISTTGKTELLNTSTVTSLDLSAGSADIATLNSGSTSISTTGLTTIGTATVDSIVLNAGTVKATSITSDSGNINITATGVPTDEDVTIGSINIDTVDSKGDTILTSENNNIELGKTTVVGALTASAGKDLIINGDTKVTGITTLSADDNLVFENTKNVVFDNDLIIKDTGAVNLESLTVNGDADINAKKIDIGEFTVKAGTNGQKGDAKITSKGETTIVKANVANDFTTDASNLKITEKLVVGGTANLGSDNNIYVKDANINILDTIGATNVTIDNLVVTKTASLVADEDITLGTSNIGGKTEITSTGGSISLGKTIVEGTLTANAEVDLRINDVTSVIGVTSLRAGKNLIFAESKQVTFDDDLKIFNTGYVNLDSLTVNANADIEAKKIDINTFIVNKDADGNRGNAKISSTGEVNINNATIANDLTTNVSNLNITEKLTVGGTANLGSDNNIYIKDAEFKGVLKTSATNMTVDDMECHGVININNTGNLTINDMLVHEVANIRSDASIDILDATMEKDLNLNSKDANIQEITLVGNLNGKVDKLKVYTENTDELKIGHIAGKSKSYATSTKITTPNTVVNGLGEEYSTKDINIYGKNITIDATTQIASPDKQLNFKLAKNNNIRLYSDGTIDVFTTGKIGNYRDIVTDNLNIKTDSDGINIYRAIVTTYGDIRLDGKHIIIDNTTWEPDLYVTLQLRSITSPHFLFVNGSPFIRTQALNSLRHGMNIYVNKTKDATSMNSWLTSSMEGQLKTSNLAEKFYDKTDKNLNIWSTLDSYIADNFAEKAEPSIVRTVKGDVITSENAKEMINSNPNAVKKRRRFFKRKQQQSVEISCK